VQGNRIPHLSCVIYLAVFGHLFALDLVIAFRRLPDVDGSLALSPVGRMASVLTFSDHKPDSYLGRPNRREAGEADLFLEW
jgi:hypothetical protein